MGIRQLLLASVIAVAPAAAMAECAVEGNGEVNVLSNFFEALEVLSAEMESCERDGLVINNKLTTEHKEEGSKAFAGASSPFDAAAVANSSITLLQAKGQLMPLNDWSTSTATNTTSKMAC